MNALEKMTLDKLQQHVTNVHKKIVSVKNVLESTEHVNTAECIEQTTLDGINTDISIVLNEISDISSTISALRNQQDLKE